MKVVLKKGPQTDLSTLVVFAAKDEKSGKPAMAKVSPELTELVDFAQQDAQFSGDRKESLFFRRSNVDGYAHVLFVGLGATSKLTDESFRQAGAIAYSALKAHKISSAAISAESLTKHARSAESALQALVEGLELTAYEYADLKSKGKGTGKTSKEEKPERSDDGEKAQAKKQKLKKAKGKDDDKKSEIHELTLVFTQAPGAAAQKAVAKAETLVECQNFARWLGDTPGNLMTPTRLAEETVKAAKGTPLKVTVWDRARIEKEQLGGLLAVSRGSAQEPRFIIMEYQGAAKSQKPVCFVGKGLTFDSGGISIKPSASMEEMKYDMCGGANVIATLLALAKLNAKVNAIGLVPASENMPGPAATKPGDVYFARNGKSVEVFNTDAEGRLILGEALVYASEQKPKAIFDAATLTGAIAVALGNTHTGVFTRDRKLMDKIQKAADAAGELVWLMPLTDFHTDDIRGTHADLCNISSGRNAGSSTAAAFLEEFVDKEIPWAHFDIAGTAWNVSSRFPYCPKKGASGIIVRTFVELAESYA